MTTWMPPLRSRHCSNSAHPGRELAREAGIERYLIKPVGAAALEELFT
jgi:hypothetical protein